jgi:hypothetical protein
LQLEGEPLLPTRLIDVGKSPDEIPRLCLSNGRRGKWVALSHCWGDRPFSKTIESNIDEMQGGIKTSTLPATFQDAIAITKCLGVRFLWIDSLCIIQDSKEDWRKEAANMPEIYRNSYVTLAAGVTKDCHSGIFVERAWVAASKPCQLPVRGGKRAGVYVDLPMNCSGGVDNYLDERAWCFQESQLSHRLLTFDRRQMSYTCLRHGLLESRGFPDPVDRDKRNTFLSLFYDTLADKDYNRLQYLFTAWYKKLADYTPRKLSFPTDKLVAISGIARVMGEFINDKYYAGLWHKALPSGFIMVTLCMRKMNLQIPRRLQPGLKNIEHPHGLGRRSMAACRFLFAEKQFHRGRCLL